MQVEVYSRDNCTFCDQAKNLLTQKNIEYTEFKIGKNLSRDRFFEIFPTAKTVPQIIIDGEHIGGYQQLSEKLND